MNTLMNVKNLLSDKTIKSDKTLKEIFMKDLRYLISFYKYTNITDIATSRLSRLQQANSIN